MLPLLRSIRPKLNAGARRVLTSRVLRDSSILLVGNYFALGMALVISAVLGRRLGPENFGLVILAMASVNFTLQFIDVRTDEALVRFMGQALARGERDAALTFFQVGVLVDMLVALVAVIVVRLVVPPLISAYPQGDALRQMVSIYLLAAPVIILQDNFDSVFTLFKQFRLKTALTIGNQVFALVLLATLAQQGEIAVLSGYVIVNLVSFVTVSGVALWLLRQNLRGAHGRDYRAAWRQFWPFAAHNSFNGSLKAIVGNLDVLLLGALASPREVSYFKIARSAVNLIALPAVPVQTVLYPLMNEAWAVGNLARVKYLVKRYMLLSAAVGITLALALALLAEVLIGLIYGDKFLPMALLIRIMAVGVTIEMISGWVRKAALANGKPHLVNFTGLLASVLYIPLDALLIYHLGAVGSALGYLAAVAMMVALNLLYVLPKLGLWSPSQRVQSTA